MPGNEAREKSIQIKYPVNVSTNNEPADNKYKGNISSSEYKTI
jgi:hypothetical protein